MRSKRFVVSGILLIVLGLLAFSHWKMYRLGVERGKVESRDLMNNVYARDIADGVRQRLIVARAVSKNRPAFSLQERQTYQRDLKACANDLEQWAIPYMREHGQTDWVADAQGLLRDARETEAKVTP